MTAENRKKRLIRLELIYVRSPIYFVTGNAHNRQKLLASVAIQDAFVEFAQQGPPHGAYVGNYVLMPDHLHGVIGVDRRDSLSQLIRDYKESQ